MNPMGMYYVVYFSGSISLQVHSSLDQGMIDKSVAPQSVVGNHEKTYGSFILGVISPIY